MNEGGIKKRFVLAILIVMAVLSFSANKFLAGCGDSPFAPSTSTTTTTGTVTTLPTPTTSNTVPIVTSTTTITTTSSTTTTSTTTTTIALSWTLMTDAPGFSSRSGHASVTTRINTNYYLWIIGGNSGTLTNDAWVLVNVGAWMEGTPEAAFSCREGHSTAQYYMTDTISIPFVIGGRETGGSRKNDVWYTDDYYIWEQATATAEFGARCDHASLRYEHDGVAYMWVIGGEGNSGLYNDVWYSQLGGTWEVATTSAAFSPRKGHCLLSFDNKIWLIGGYDGAYKNDVWYSSDGISWTQATSSAAFAPRYDHAAARIDDFMWVIGGSTEASPYNNDVWYSNDGVNWLRASDADFTPRCGHTCTAHQSRLWVIGGQTSTGKQDDVWYLDPF